jgi:hypothetical protein
MISILFTQPPLYSMHCLPYMTFLSNASLLNTVQLHGAMLLSVEDTAFPPPSRCYIWLRGEHSRSCSLQRTNGVLHTPFCEAGISVGHVHGVLCFYAQTRRLSNKITKYFGITIVSRTYCRCRTSTPQHHFFLL